MTDVISQISLSSLADASVDLLIIGVLLSILLFYGVSRGKRKMIALFLSFYVMSLLFLVFPYWDEVEAFAETAREFLIFKVIIFIAGLFLVRVGLARVVSDSFIDSGLRRSGEVFVLSIVSTGLLISYAHQLFPVSTFYQFTPPFNILFTPPEAYFFWLIAGLGTLFIFRWYDN